MQLGTSEDRILALIVKAAGDKENTLYYLCCESVSVCVQSIHCQTTQCKDYGQLLIIGQIGENE